MREGLVSVVVPIYKTEKYLDQCIASIVNQTYSNLEILLIDDGSPDRCPQICDEWAKRDNRIKVIHKKNAGLGMARNTGIENANGEYICFFDSDDYVDLNTIMHAYEACKRENADVALFGFVIADSNGEPLLSRIPSPLKRTYSGNEVQDLLLPDLIGVNPKTGRITNLRMSAWTCVFASKVIKGANWRFVSEKEIISEDVYSLLGLYQHVKKAVILEEALYYYRDNQSSVTRTYRKDRFDRVKEFYMKCLQLCRESEYGKEAERRCSEPFLAFTIAALKQEVAYHTCRKEAILRVQDIISDELLQKVLKEKKKDKMKLSRRILFWAMRHKWYDLCYSLLMAKNKAGGK